MYRLEKNQLEQAINQVWRRPSAQPLEEAYNHLMAAQKNKTFARRFGLEKVKEELSKALGQEEMGSTYTFSEKQFSDAVYEYQQKQMPSGRIKIADGIIDQRTMNSLLLLDVAFHRAYERKNPDILQKEFSSISQQHKTMSYHDFRETIAKNESQGMGGYQARNRNTTAIGRYQFIWGFWGKKIKPFARKLGYRNVTPAIFLKSPKLQDAWFAYYYQNTLKKQASTIKSRYAEHVKGWSDEQLMALIHFKGYHAAKTYITTGVDKYPDFNKSIPEYLHPFPGIKNAKTSHQVELIAKK